MAAAAPQYCRAPYTHFSLSTPDRPHARPALSGGAASRAFRKAITDDRADSGPAPSRRGREAVLGAPRRTRRIFRERKAPAATSGGPRGESGWAAAGPSSGCRKRGRWGGPGRRPWRPPRRRAAAPRRGEGGCLRRAASVNPAGGGPAGRGSLPEPAGDGAIARLSALSLFPWQERFRVANRETRAALSYSLSLSPSLSAPRTF